MYINSKEELNLALARNSKCSYAERLWCASVITADIPLALWISHCMHPGHWYRFACCQSCKLWQHIPCTAGLQTRLRQQAFLLVMFLLKEAPPHRRLSRWISYLWNCTAHALVRCCPTCLQLIFCQHPHWSQCARLAKPACMSFARP